MPSIAYLCKWKSPQELSPAADGAALPLELAASPASLSSSWWLEGNMSARSGSNGAASSPPSSAAPPPTADTPHLRLKLACRFTGLRLPPFFAFFLRLLLDDAVTMLATRIAATTADSMPHAVRRRIEL